MKKVFSIIFIVIGIGIITTGIYLQINKSPKTNVQEEKEEKQDLFVKLNPHNLENTCTTYNKISTYINTSNYKKINIEYPDCVHEYDLSIWYKNLNNETDDISMKINIEKDSVNNFLNSKKTLIIAKKNNDMYQNVQYSDITNIKLNNEITLSILQHSYQMNFYQSSITYDVWDIALPIEQDNILTYEIITKNKIISYETIKDILSNITVDDNANFKNSTIDGEYQIGTLKQNKSDSYEHGYKLTYKVPNKYPEADTYSSNYDNSIFSSEDINQKTYISIELLSEKYNTIQEEIQSMKDSTVKTYMNEESYKNYKNNDIIQKNINNKNIFYFIHSYDYYLENKKSHTAYISYVYYQIAPNFFYRIYINNRNVEINEAFITTFLNFEVEEY